MLLGTGLRFFADSGLDRVELEKIGVQEVGARTSLSFRVKNSPPKGPYSVTSNVTSLDGSAYPVSPSGEFAAPKTHATRYAPGPTFGTVNFVRNEQSPVGAGLGTEASSTTWPGPAGSSWRSGTRWWPGRGSDRVWDVLPDIPPTGARGIQSRTFRRPLLKSRPVRRRTKGSPEVDCRPTSYPTILSRVVRHGEPGPMRTSSASPWPAALTDRAREAIIGG
jgi:hypothetical protein